LSQAFAAFLKRNLPAALLALVTAFPNTAQASLLITDQPIKQGQTVEVLVDQITQSHALPQLKFNQQNIRLFAAPERLLDHTPDVSPVYSALLPIPADLAPGKYTINCAGQQKQITVVSGKFPLQKITLPKSKDNFLESPGEQEAVDKAKATISADRFWQGPFKPPSKARTSTVFGVRRMVNGKLLKDYFHSGLDFAGGLGSPVTACADGKVILAKKGFRLHGNIIAIDHGQGVISFYIHLHKILVKPDQVVKAGELIGQIGQTGRANGPHLHFSLYVNQVATNPRDWFSQYY
jgi:murein DD-endopeptidase MepM/ murein hydrolase activator NlpD